MNNQEAKQCEWIEPYPLDSTERCTAHAVPRGLYCTAHQMRGVQAGTALRRRHKDIRRANHIFELSSLFDEVVAEMIADGELDL